jgi:hypothetical protein
MSFQGIRESLEAPEWLSLEAFMAQERLSASDVVRMLQTGIAPHFQTVNNRVWVHTQTLYDWRELLRALGFETSLMRASHD